MPDKKVVGARLRKLRGNKKLETVARACGIAQSTLSMYESGERMPKDSIKVLLANYYKKSVQYIFYRE